MLKPTGTSHHLIAGAALACLLLFGSGSKAIEPVTAVEGRIDKIDRAAKTVVVKAADGTEHTFHLVSRTVVHGAHTTRRGTEAAASDLREGSEVVVHSTKRGTQETAEEIDHLGTNGLKSTEGTVTSFDRTTKRITIKTADGSEQAYRLSSEAAKDVGKTSEDAAKRSAHVTVYYTEEAGHKVAHFFKSL